MPFAQHHYPFENKELFEQQFPAQFISEAVDQTRGWFHSLMAISTLLFNKAPYENVIVLGHVQDENGQKMSKSKVIHDRKLLKIQSIFCCVKIINICVQYVECIGIPGMEQDKINAYMTLYTALVTVVKAAAPMIPFMTEAIYRNLVCSIDKSAFESVHLWH